MKTPSLLNLRAALAAAMVALVMPATPDVVTDYAVGRKGAALKQTLRQHCAPTDLSANKTDADTYLTLLSDANSDADGMVTDGVGGVRYTKADARLKLTAINVIDKSWFGYPASYKTDAAADLYNVLLTCADVMQSRSTHMAFADFGSGDGSAWRSGTVTVGGWNIPAIEPADAVKGIVARRIFYLSTLYPCVMWSGDGEKFFVGSEYPGLSDYSISTYLKWHRDHPVSDAERRCNDVVAARQGNRNPFVDYPALAEYLWGEHADDVYLGDNTNTEGPSTGDENGSGDDSSGDDTAETVKVPLRGAYKLADEYLDLYSPYVPTDVVWSIDGVTANEQRIKLATIGVGQHELRYTGANNSGKLIITITE
jgi:hypothetical protein